MGSHRSSGEPPVHAQRVMDDLRRLVQALRTGSQRAKANAGLSSAQLFVLSRLHEHGDATINQLAALTMTHQSSVSVVVAKLERAQLVRRKRNPKDRRAVVVGITPLGTRKITGAPSLIQTDLVRALSLLEPADLISLATLLNHWVALAGLSDRTPVMFFEPIPLPRSTHTP